MVVGRWGETGKTGFVRGKQHYDKIQATRKSKSKADLDNGLVVHNLDFHEGEQPNYRVNVKESFKNPTQRQIAEGVAIHGSKDTVTMNHKYEWVQPVTSKLVVSRQVGDGWRERLTG